MNPLIVKAVWDGEAEVWVATSDDVPGLVTESATFDDLMQKLKVLIPEMLDENGYPDGDKARPFRVLAECDAVTDRIAA